MARVRELALALPEAAEEPHHEISSFRVRGKIFATVPDAQHLRVFVDDDEADAACAESPGACAPLLWGEKRRGVVLTVRAAPVALVAELLTEAWRRKAPPSLRGAVSD